MSNQQKQNTMITRENLMAELSAKYPKMFLRTTEEFDGGEGGIWSSGEDGLEDEEGLPLFSYYSEAHSLYEFGVRIPLAKWLAERGWYAEWHDAGTIMLYED